MDGQRLMILKMLLESKDYLSYDTIAGRLSISSRSVARFIKDIEQYTKRYGVQLFMKKRFGFRLEGESEQLEQLMSSIEQQKIFSYTSNERMIIIMLELLSNEDSVKLYYLSYLLNVSVGTINRDLETIQEYLFMNHIQLQTQRGIGVYLEGDRKDLLWVAANFILPYIEFRKNADGSSQLCYNHLLCLDVQTRLSKFQKVDQIMTMQRLIDAFDYTLASDFIQEDYHHYLLFTTLLVYHGKLWNQRRMEPYPPMLLHHPVQQRMQEFSKKLERELQHPLSQEEGTMLCSAYLAMRKNDARIDSFRYDEAIYETTIRLLDAIEQELQQPLNRDMNLIDRLTMHLKLMLNRVQMGVIISNSYMETVREEYPEVFLAVKRHIDVFQEEYHCVINDNELGYITIHVLATLMEQENKKQRIKAAILCMSGMGTSKMLKERLQHKYPLMDVEFAYSIHNFNEALLIKKGFDLIISTILIETIALPCVIVHPLMSEYDFDTLNQMYFKIIEAKGYQHKGMVVKESAEKLNVGGIEKQELLSKLTAVEQIISDFALENCKVHSYQELIRVIAQRELQEESQQAFLDWVTRREQYGSTIIEESGIILVHGRIKEERCLKIYECDKPFSYLVEGKDYKIKKALIMIAPEHCEEYYLSLMSAVSTAFVQSKVLLQAIQEHQQQVILQEIAKALLLEVA